ncbi:unnamed protein product [Victoria cruziana]
MRLSTLVVICRFSLLFLRFATTPTEAYDPLDPNGNITIKWDVVQWTADGYGATVTIFNFQRYRHIDAPGWILEWTWARKEVIWDIRGAQATDQGDCSSFKSNLPHCCKKSPTIVDLLPGTPYNMQVANCCKGGVISSVIQDPVNSASSFFVVVGSAGTSNATVTLPSGFTLSAPGPGYTCGLAKIGEPSKFLTPDGRRVTRALMTWNVTCTYSQFLAQRAPTCCVSFSSFYNDTIIPCPTCTCGCKNSVKPGSCVEANSSHSAAATATGGSGNYNPLLQCTNHMCPIRVHWHVKLNYKEYWRVKISIINFNYKMNYTQWNLVVQHPNFDRVTEIFSFNYESLSSYGVINDTAIFWGIKYYNDMLLEAGPLGNVQSELIFQKDPATFTFKEGWAFPRRIYFNGDNCVLPPPDAYPWLPNFGHQGKKSSSAMETTICMVFLVFLISFM